MRYVILIILSGFIFSCTNKNKIPTGILKPEKMQDVFWDYLRADVYTTDHVRKDSNRNAVLENIRLQDKIFKLHQTSREQFDKSFTWYTNHRELMTNMIDSMVARKQREIGKTKPVFNSL
jgi:hypothetical protein